MECCRICRYTLDGSFPLHQSYLRSSVKRGCLFCRQTLHLQWTVSFPCSSSSISHRSLFRTSPFFVVSHLFNFHSFIHFVIPSLTYLLSVITVISLNLHSIDCAISMMAADSSALMFVCLSPRSFSDQLNGWHGAQNTPQPAWGYLWPLFLHAPSTNTFTQSIFLVYFQKLPNDDLKNCK